MRPIRAGDDLGKTGHVRPILQLERGSWPAPTAHYLIWYPGGPILLKQRSQSLGYYCTCVVFLINN